MRDPDGFDDLYRSTCQRLLRYAYAICLDRCEAQDLVQEAYTRAWRHWRTLSDHPAPEAWLRLVVNRLATDRLRRLLGLRAAMSGTGVPESGPPPGEDTVLLVNALRQLPARHRQVLALHYLFDLSVDEIAREIGSPAGTVKSWLSRGRAGLATLLDTETNGFVEATDGR